MNPRREGPEPTVRCIELFVEEIEDVQVDENARQFRMVFHDLSDEAAGLVPKGVDFPYRLRDVENFHRSLQCRIGGAHERFVGNDRLLRPRNDGLISHPKASHGSVELLV